MNASLAGLPPRPDPPKPALLSRASSGVKWFQGARSGRSSGGPSSLGATASMLAGLGNLLRGHTPANYLDTAPSGTDAAPSAQLDMTPPLGANADDNGAERGISDLEAAAASHPWLASDQPALLLRGVGPGGHEPERPACGSLEGETPGHPNGHA